MMTPLFHITDVIWSPFSFKRKAKITRRQGVYIELAAIFLVSEHINGF